VAMEGVSDLSRKGYFVEYSRKAAMYLPACRMSHTGVRSTCSPLAARTRMSRSPGDDEDAVVEEAVVEEEGSAAVL
jgi:hypothetical protein